MTQERLDTNKIKKAVKTSGLSKISLIFGLLIVLSAGMTNVSGQIGNGSLSSAGKDTSGNADQSLRSIARVNPSTLAMEFSMPMMNYPGRGGNSLPLGINYSSKTWRMESGLTWWYRINWHTRYVTDIYARYSERSAAGWTSTLTPPRIDESSPQLYTLEGRPWSNEILDEQGLNNSWQDVLRSFADGNSMMPCGIGCSSWVYQCPNGWFCHISEATIVCGNYVVEWCDIGGGGPIFPEPPPPTPLYYIKRLQVAMPDGSTHEFRESDAPIVCGTNQAVCTPNMNGTYLSVDGSGMKLVRNEDGSTLYMSNGSRFIFPVGSSGEGTFANEYIDNDGNRMSFLKTTTDNITTNTWTDTMGRDITDVLPHNWVSQTQTIGTKIFELPGLGSGKQTYKLKWENLKPLGCEAIEYEPECTNELRQVGGALEDQNQKLYYETRYFCRGNISDDLLTDTTDPNNPINEVLFPERETGVRPCNNFNILRDSNGEPILDGDGLAQPISTRFNPVVLSEIELPNNKKYIFKYNRYGEISKIVYPTGSYETFEYKKIEPLNGGNSVAYDQTNRGVFERRIYDVNGTLQQRWQYIATAGQITTIAPKGDNPMANGIKTERTVYTEWSDGSNFGFTSPAAGMPLEEKTFDENGNLRSRTLNEFITKNSGNANRDARVKRTVSVMIENGKALASLSEVSYDENGSADGEHFSHLNVKQTKSYHHKAILVNTAEYSNLGTIAGLFTNDTPATIGETVYVYNENYKARGIASLPVITRAVDPTDPSNILGEKHILYDNLFPYPTSNYPYSTETYTISTLPNSTYDCSNNAPSKICWKNPNSIYLGRPTTSVVWNKDTNTWIESHVRYDIFGNVVKVKDAIGNEATTIFTGNYKYAYPETVITPAPDPTNTHGTNQTSQASTVYDFMTGLPLTLTDDFGQTIRTEYNDSLLRPTKVLGVNVTVPITETIYDDNALTVKVRSQIDEVNWAEQTSFANSLGQVYKSQTKDLQGDVSVLAEYDLLGRVKRTSNPYRQGETVMWSKPRYDELGRVVESYAPAVDGQTGASLGTVEFGISDAAGFVGSFVVAKDASGRRARTISNKFGIIRVDEATGMGGATADADLGSLESPNQPTTYQYDQLGNLIQVNQGGQTRTFTYDSFSRIKTATNPESGTVSYTYDFIGNLKTKRDARGIKTIYDYDKANRITNRCYRVIGTGSLGATTCAGAGGETVEPNTPDVNYFYDGKGLATQQSPNFAKGKLTKVSSSVSETLYTNFDNFGRLTNHQQITDGQIYPTSYKYSLSGALTEETYPSGKIVRNFYDADGGLSRVVKNGKTFASDFAYTSAGVVEKMRLGNGLWESTVYNERFQPTQLGLGNSPTNTTNLWKINYEYGELQANGTTVDAAKNNGNIAKQTITVPTIGAAQGFTATQTYTYDALNRLKQAKETIPNQTGWQQTFNYDRFGNRSFDEANTTTLPKLCLENGLPVVCANDRKSLNPTVNQTNNRFTLTEDYEYDANGNMTRDADGRRFTYDALNKQTQVKDSNNQPLGTYVYDGDGKRIKKLGSTENTLFVYDAFGSLVAEYAITPPPSNPTPNVNYLTTDTLGSPRIITGKNGEILSRRDFMPFGEEIAANENNRKAALGYNGGITTRQAFTGYEKDIESSLEFAQNRYYANKHGRFTTPDPLMASGNVQDAQSWNRYAYVRNNPLNLTDPLGLIYGEGVEDGRNVVKWFESREAMVAAGFTELTTFIYALNGGFQVFNPTGAQGAEWFATAGQAVEQFIKWGGSPGAAEKFLGRAVGFPQAAAIVAVVVGGLAVAQEGVETQVREGVVCDSRTGVCVQLQKSQANSQDLTDEELNEMVPPVQNITNTATPNPQDPNEKPPQDPNKPTKDQSFNNVVNNPQENLVGKSADEVAKILGPGWQRGNYGKTGTGWKFTNGDKVVFYHEGGRHKGAYWGYSSGQTGKVKFVGKDYVPLPGDKAKIISIVTNK